jgi:hypothetical protein
MARQNAVFPIPLGLTTPMPVITARLSIVGFYNRCRIYAPQATSIDLLRPKGVQSVQRPHFFIGRWVDGVFCWRCGSDFFMGKILTSS